MTIWSYIVSISNAGNEATNDGTGNHSNLHSNVHSNQNGIYSTNATAESVTAYPMVALQGQSCVDHVNDGIQSLYR